MIDSMILVLILSTSLFIQMVPSNCVDPREQKFRSVIEFWTETLCSVRSTKTLIFHRVFNNQSYIMRNFFDTLLRTTSDYCGAIVIVNNYVLRNESNEFNRNQTNIMNRKNRGKKAQQSMVEISRDFAYNIRREASWKLIYTEDLFERTQQRKENVSGRRDLDMWNIHVIFLEDSDSFLQLLDQQTPFVWNKREHFIILAIWEGERLRDRQSVIDGILKKLWLEHRIQNVFFIEPFVKDPNSAVSSYNPFAKINDTTWGKVEIVQARTTRHMLYLLSTLTYRRTLTLNGYRLNVSLFEQYQTIMKIKNPQQGTIYKHSAGYNGTDGILLGTIAKHMDFIVNVIRPSGSEKFGYQLDNGSYVGAVADVVYHRVEACFVSFFVKKYASDMSVMEFTTYVGFDKICVTVPKAHKIPKGFRIYRMFHPYVWLSIMLTQVLAHMSWYYLQVFSPWRSQPVDYHTTMYRMFLVNSGHPTKLPRTLSERILMLGIFVSSMTLMGTFNGALYKVFARDMYYKDIDLLTEVDASGLPILFSSYSLSDVFGSMHDSKSSAIMKSLRSKLRQGRNSIHTTALHRNVTALLRKQTYPLLRETLKDKDGSRLLHLARECPGKFYLAYLLPKNSILRERINVMISRLNQAGLPTLWQKRTLQSRALKMKINLEDHITDLPGFVPYNLSDVQTCFFVLGTGLLLSIVAFFDEKGWLKIRLGRTTRKKDEH